MAKFCTKCGRKLEDGETCTCSTQGTIQPGAPKTPVVPVNNPVNEQAAQPRTQQPNAGQYQGQPNPGQPNPGQFQRQPNAGQYQGQPNSGQFQRQPNQGQFQGQPNPGQFQGQPGMGQPNPGQFQGQPGMGQPNPGQYQQGMYGGQTPESQWFNQKRTAFVAGTKNMFAEILPILKAPVTESRNLAMQNNGTIGFEFIGAKALILILIAIIGCLRLNSLAQGYLQIPYFKIILIILVMTAGFDCLEALFLKLFSGIANASVSYQAMIVNVGTRAMFEAIIYVIMGILALLSIPAASVVTSLLVLATPYLQYASYKGMVRMSDDKAPYIFYGVKVCMTIISIILIVMFASSIATSLASAVGNSIGYGFNSLF